MLKEDTLQRRKIRAFNTKFGRMGMLICEDAWHQSAHYILAQDGAKYIFSIANAPARLGMNKTSVSATWKALLKSSSILYLMEYLI